MKFDYQYKITFDYNEPLDIDFINNVCKKYPNKNILVEVKNTKGITSSELKNLNSNVKIRVSGGYDEQRVKINKGKQYKTGETGEYYVNSVIYTRNELIKILEEFEYIERGIDKNWKPIQKVVYVYDRLKSGIMYDPDFEKKLSTEIRSLRGIVTKKTVCAGFSLIFKEFMDRQDIFCEYVEGYINGDKNRVHAWNIVSIDGKKYPIDLTWDNTKFRAGKSRSFDFLGQNIIEFSKSHVPLSYEKTQDYKNTLSQLNPDLIKEIILQVQRAVDFKKRTYCSVRKDGSKYILAQVGDATKDNSDYYRYYYADILENGKLGAPLILYSDTNVANFIDAKNFGRPIPDNYGDALDNILFSRENIMDSLKRETHYIGKIKKCVKGNKAILYDSVAEIEKPDERRKLFNYPTKTFFRSDGSVFIAQQMLGIPFEVKGIKVMRYDIFEMVKENGIYVLKKNTVFTEKNFFNDLRQDMVDDYLSRERLDRKVKEAGGYIGYYSDNGIRTYNPNLVTYFKTVNALEMDAGTQNHM